MDERENRTELPAVVYNRDVPVLAEVLAVMQLIDRTEALRERRMSQATRITAQLTGMPRGGGGGGLDAALAALDELDRALSDQVAEYARVLRRAERILNGIESRSMRAFVVLRYVMDEPDARIRRALCMTRRGFERAVRCVEDAPDMASVIWRERFYVE